MTDSTQRPAEIGRPALEWLLWLIALVVAVLGLAALWSLAGLGPRSTGQP